MKKLLYISLIILPFCVSAEHTSIPIPKPILKTQADKKAIKLNWKAMAISVATSFIVDQDIGKASEITVPVCHISFTIHSVGIVRKRYGKTTLHSCEIKLLTQDLIKLLPVDSYDALFYKVSAIVPLTHKNYYYSIRGTTPYYGHHKCKVTAGERREVIDCYIGFNKLELRSVL